MGEAERVPLGVDASRPSPARMYDRYLGGSANFQVDRDAVDRILELVPEIRDAAWANPGFLQRAVRWMAGRGMRQLWTSVSGCLPNGALTRWHGKFGPMPGCSTQTTTRASSLTGSRSWPRCQVRP